MLMFQIEKIEEGDVVLRFMKKVANLYVFSNIDDRSFVFHKEIMELLTVLCRFKRMIFLWNGINDWHDCFSFQSPDPLYFFQPNPKHFYPMANKQTNKHTNKQKAAWWSRPHKEHWQKNKLPT